MGAHTDTTMMGIGVGGLGNRYASCMEMDLAETWVSSAHIPSEDLLVWPGDFLAALTKHRIQSTVHRIPKKAATRFSSPVLVRIDPEKMLDPSAFDGTCLMSPGENFFGRNL